MRLNGAEHHKLAGGKLGIWNGLLKNRHMPLIRAAQQMSNLLGEIVVVAVRRVALACAHKGLSELANTAQYSRAAAG
jgi:hypothetical protein